MNIQLNINGLSEIVSGGCKYGTGPNINTPSVNFSDRNEWVNDIIELNESIRQQTKAPDSPDSQGTNMQAGANDNAEQKGVGER